MRLAGVEVARGQKPFVIAEISGNHSRSAHKAIELIEASWAAGASAVKLQTFDPERMTLDAEGPLFYANPAGPWKGEKLIDLYRRSALPMEEQRQIFRHCAAKGIRLFSTPFDEPSVEFLESVANPIYKIASFELVHLPLVRRAAATGKPLIISTGMAMLGEIEEAVRAAREAGARELALLKCTSAYPAAPSESNLAAIPRMRAMFGCEIGLSDHTLGIGAAIAAVGLGATLIEKHVTLSREQGDIDSAFSLEPAELAMLVKEVQRAAEAVGQDEIGPAPSETAARERRRSLYVVAAVRKGEPFTARNVDARRPALGLAPKHYPTVLERKAARDLAPGTPLSWDDCA